MKKHTKLDKPLLLIMLVFVIFGLVMILSASSMTSYMRYDKNIYDYFIKQGIFIIFGFFLYLMALLLPTALFKKMSFGLMGVLIIALGGLFFFANDQNGSLSWYDLGIITIQPSEIGKIIIILFLAYFYQKHKDELSNQWFLLCPIFICVIIFVMVAMQPDLGTGLVIVLMVIFIFYTLPLSRKDRMPVNRLLFGGIILLVLVFILTGGSFLQNYQLSRLNFLNPCERYEEVTGYQLCNSFIAFKNGGLFGLGIGKSTQKYLYLPEAYTDFIFPIIVEEWGLIVGIIILAMYVFMLIRILNIAKRASNLGNAIIAYGTFCYVLVHVLINLSGVMGIAPMTGVPLPFLSYGGSYTVTLLFSMGLVQRVHYETYLKEKKNGNN